jgi:hypothetical protein
MMFLNQNSKKNPGSETRIFSEHKLHQRIAFVIGKTAAQDHNEVDQSPNSATSAEQKHNDRTAGFTYIETVSSKASEKEAQQRCGHF